MNFTAPLLQSSAQLYADTDFSQLSRIESLWASWYLWFGDPFVATGLLSFAVHEIVYFGRSVPWIVIDAIPYFQQWKLQPNRIPSLQEQWQCAKLVLIMHFVVELPLIWSFFPMAQMVGMSTWEVPFPSWTSIVFQVSIFFVLEDLFHFFAHRALHWGPLYKHIHKVHHKYSAPFGLAAEYAHPAEIAILGTGTIGAPLLYCACRPHLHLFTVYIWIVLRNFQSIDAHSGYDFPWSLHHFIPFWSGAAHHDFHHMSFVNNFSTSFRWCDWLFGTDKKYRAYCARMSAMKKINLTKAALAEMEKVMLAETEAEGLEAEAAAESYQRIRDMKLS